MAIAIIPGSGRITHIDAAGSDAPTINGGVWNFAPDPAMHAEGEVRFNGAAGDPRAGWHVGWIQAQWIETNWAYYRGQFNNHGSLFLQRGKPPARPRQACRDTSGAVATIFTDPTDPKEFQDLPAAGAFPLTINVETNDPPGENYNAEEDNGATGQPNYLHEVQLEFHFCTVLTVQDPAGRFHHQAHFYWNVHWQYRFQPTAFPPADGDWRVPAAVAGGNTAAASRAFSGAPADARFANVLTTAQTKSCVDLAGDSARAVQNTPVRREFAVWQSVDVRR